MARSPVMVVAGSFRAGASERGVSDAFRDIGWAVQEVGQWHNGESTGRHPALRIASRLTRGLADDLYCAKILSECRTLKPDVFLTVKGTGISGVLLRQIKETGARTVMYYPDYHFDHLGVSIESFKEYDLFVTTKSFQIRHLQNLLGIESVAYVPHGFSGRIHKPLHDAVTEKDLQFDVLYSGNHSPYKQQWLKELSVRVPEVVVDIIGSRWREALASEPMARCVVHGERWAASYATAIQTAKVNVAIHFGPTASGWEDRVSTRTFEIPACKGFMLHIDNDEVREFFEPGVEIDVFSTPEELADKTRFYLARPDLRGAMIERAYRRCVPAYSYAARAKQMADLMTSRWEIRAV